MNALVFAVLLLDGYDTTALGFVVPALAQEWGRQPAAFTPALVATNIGVVIGYLVCGRLSARFGRRKVITSGTVLFGIGSALTALVHDPSQLTGVRALTALGLGIVLPTSVSLVADQSPTSRRSAHTVAVTLALSVGAAAGGLVGGRLIAALGWTSVFWLGAVLPAVLAPALYRWLPPEPDGAESRTAPGGKAAPGVRALFPAGAGVSTVLLWGFAFLVFTTMFALQAWLPTLLATGYGVTPEQAPLGSAALGFGGVVGGALLVPVAARFGVPRALAVAVPVAGVLLVAVSRTGTSGSGLFLLIAAAGAGIAVGVVGQAALAAGMYSSEARTTGIAWAAAMGRAGSVAGPAAVGALIGAGVSGQDVILLTVVPVAGAALIALVVAVRTRRGRRTGAGDVLPAD
ncbi:MFS transporter [Streptomyces sp. NPDC048623]|uniref:MFS transporter n=1 Tax=Streptomyces sp. NPDC048623 TaxID=3155761 RepID=UPI00341BD565